MHKENYYYTATLSDGTKVRFERSKWVPDHKGEYPGDWMPATKYNEIMDAYAEFRQMTEM